MRCHDGIFMGKRIHSALITFLCMFCTQSIAYELDSQVSASVALVIDPVTFELTSGETVRLEGLGSPRAPADHRDRWPYLIEATEDVRALLSEGHISYVPRAAPDRYGRVIAQVWLEDGTWLNGALADQGLARVETTTNQRRCAGDALAHEFRAREAGLGMWRLSAYEIRRAEETAAFTNDFQIVEGLIVSASEVRGRIYLNFGEEWRTDFTVTIAPSDVARFAESGLDPLSWSGQSLRVRGWLEWYNGPQIEASHPEQIEFPGGVREEISNEDDR